MGRKVTNGMALLRRAPKTVAAALKMLNQTTLSNREHLALTADALLNASRHSTDGGYSAAYSLIHGWLHGYVETTGYIVPTALDIADLIDRPDLRADALKQGEWLLGYQQADGSFPDIDRHGPAAFDTGQVLMGLQRLFLDTKDAKYEAAARRACDWLSSHLKEDGTWPGVGSDSNRSPSYLTRTAAAMIDFGQLVGESAYVDTGRRFLNWAATQQLPSGLFRHSELVVGTPYLLHTVIYVLEGFLHAYEMTGERAWLEAVVRGADPLKKVNLEREITLFTYYDADLKPVTSEKNLAGLSQWADLCLRLYKITGDASYFECASNALFYVKSKQLQVDGPLRGAIPGSVPFWGAYMRLAFPNWNLKFFADALLRWERTALGEADQQEMFVKRSHHIYGDKAGWTEWERRLSDFDKRMLRYIDRIIACNVKQRDRPPVVLDLGCGAGRCLDWLQERHRDWKFIGVDPIETSRPGHTLLVGTASHIPLEDDSVDGIYAYIAMQHVGNIDSALREGWRVLKKGGVFVIFDRNPLSFRGLLKFWHQANGRWIYSWDSPFRERWYTLGRWRSLLRKTGYRILAARTFTARGGRGLRSLLPINRFVLLAARKGTHAAILPSPTGPLKPLVSASVD